MNEEKKPVRKKFECQSVYNKVMANHFFELDEASRTGSKKIAWCTSVGPAELLRGMGFLVYFPENHGAMLGATRMATDLIPYANAIGYSPDICSYLTSDIGSFIKKQTPLTDAYKMKSVPKPDVLVFNTNQCRDVQDWFAWYSRELNVPMVGIHTHRDIGEIRDFQVSDIAKQTEGLIPELEKVSNEKFDIDRFKEVIELSKQTSALWRACLESASASPC
jgi:benzoyl-CoA reductase/2-hydroxyglutaryl-CoA dehydratase subunit BcrC/BadD/HgdB